MRIGIIGTGNMGGMLASAFARTSPDDIFIYNRSRQKAVDIAACFPNLVVCDSWKSLVSQVDAVFLCTKSTDGMALMRVLGPALRRDQILMTTISSVALDRLRELTAATPIKLIPSLTQTVSRGVLLLSYPRDVESKTRHEIEEKLSLIGNPHVIDEAQVRVCSDLTSCGPAFLSVLCLGWAQAAAQTGKIDKGQAETLLSEMLIGLAGLLDSGLRFEDVVNQIKVPGGVTEFAIEGMGDTPRHLFSRLHECTSHHASGRNSSDFRAEIVSPWN